MKRIVGHERIIKTFAFLPIYLHDHSEWRWLENVVVRQKYFFGQYPLIYYWANIEFID